MNIQLIRNASIVIRYDRHTVVVDPCLNPKGSLPPYTLFRKKPKLNPLVDLPENTASSLEGITAGLITHCRYGHFDHLDGTGRRFLKESKVPVYCTPPDHGHLKRCGMEAVPLRMNQWSPFPGGSIMPVPTAHGRGLEGWLMRPGAGYVIDLIEGKKIYIAGDTVMTDTVRHVLTELKPDIAVINAGTPVLDFGRPILMTIPEMLEFIEMAPGMVIAVHMDAFNHCLTSRADLRQAMAGSGFSGKVQIPQDGETVII